MRNFRYFGWTLISFIPHIEYFIRKLLEYLNTNTLTSKANFHLTSFNDINFVRESTFHDSQGKLYVQRWITVRCNRCEPREQGGYSDISDKWIMATIFGSWWHNFNISDTFWMFVSDATPLSKKIEVVSDENGQNRHQHLKVVKHPSTTSM